jgi:hypothetical protein
VERNVNPLYWRLIREFGLRTGVPVIVNHHSTCVAKRSYRRRPTQFTHFSTRAWMHWLSEVLWWKNKY